jgi:hypothetical protein
LKLLDSQVVTGVRRGVAWASRIVVRVVGKGFVTGRTAIDSVIIHDSEFCEKTRGLGSTSTAVDIVGAMLWGE